MAHEFIYQAYKLARHYPPDKTVLENISLSFYPGAKIGVLGSNGAGKSSLLKIMAGLDDCYVGVDYYGGDDCFGNGDYYRRDDYHGGGDYGCGC